MDTLVSEFVARNKCGCILFETGRKYVHRVTTNAKVQVAHFRSTKTLPDTLGYDNADDDMFLVGPSLEDKVTVADIATNVPMGCRLFLVAHYTQPNPYIKKAVQGFDETMCLCLVWSSKDRPSRPHFAPHYRLICEWSDHDPKTYAVAKSKHGEYGHPQQQSQ